MRPLKLTANPQGRNCPITDDPIFLSDTFATFAVKSSP